MNSMKGTATTDAPRPASMASQESFAQLLPLPVGKNALYESYQGCLGNCLGCLGAVAPLCFPSAYR